MAAVTPTDDCQANLVLQSPSNALLDVSDLCRSDDWGRMVEASLSVFNRLSPPINGICDVSSGNMVACWVKVAMTLGELKKRWPGWAPSRRHKARHTLRHSTRVVLSTFIKPATKEVKQSTTSSSSATLTTPVGREAVRWHTKSSRCRTPSRWNTATMPPSGRSTSIFSARLMNLCFGCMPYMLWQNRTMSYFSPWSLELPFPRLSSRMNGVRWMTGGFSRESSGDSVSEVEQSHSSNLVANKPLGSNAVYFLTLPSQTPGQVSK